MGECSLNDINPQIIACVNINKDTCPQAGVKYGERIVKWHEVELILWGEGHILTDGKMLSARKGSVFYRTPGMVVQGICPYHCIMVIFDTIADSNKTELYAKTNPVSIHSTENQEDYVGQNVISTFPEVMHYDNISKLEELFSCIYSEYVNTGCRNQFLLKTYLLQILSHIHLSKSTNYQKII